MLIEVEKLLTTKNTAAMTLPTIVTMRQPNLFAKALTIGPKEHKNVTSYNYQRRLSDRPTSIPAIVLMMFNDIQSVGELKVKGKR